MYQGTPDGTHCLRLVSSGCFRPYGGIALMEQSVSGDPEAPYCGFDQVTVSCDAIAALRASRQCPEGDASACMAEGARCETIGALTNRCTYTCGVDDDCPETRACGAGYCGS